MSFRDRIAACNRYDLSQFRPVFVDDAPIGWVRHDLVPRLAAFPDALIVDDVSVRLAPQLDTHDARTAAMARVARALDADGTIAGWRGELFPVATHFGAPELFRIERAAASLFGIRAAGVHLNGFVRKNDGLHLWIGRRALDKPTYPGKLDHMVAGAQPAGLSLRENLVKECDEEAGVPEALARRAVSVGAISYILANEGGLKRDTLFCFDLEVPADFVPRNRDGEIAEFTLRPAAEVMEIVRDTDDFKLNCNLVIIDFLIRHGIIGPEEPDYLDLLADLHGSLV
ncbi:MAG: DUF4743 domain-containing protein [Alphaproteobacteria bacterium]|nr:DUF4743 domain-containing protein [Alphaproteobacteria bacterium]